MREWHIVDSDNHSLWHSGEQYSCDLHLAQRFTEELLAPHLLHLSPRRTASFPLCCTSQFFTTLDTSAGRVRYMDLGELPSPSVTSRSAPPSRSVGITSTMCSRMATKRGEAPNRSCRFTLALCFRRTLMISLVPGQLAAWWRAVIPVRSGLSAGTPAESKTSRSLMKRFALSSSMLARSVAYPRTTRVAYV